MLRKRAIGWVTLSDGSYMLAEEYADMGASRASGVVRNRDGEVIASMTHRRRGAGGSEFPATGFCCGPVPRLELQPAS